MKITISVLFVLVLSIAAFGQDKAKTFDELTDQMFALPTLGCGVRRSKPMEVGIVISVRCSISDTDSKFGTFVAFSFKGKELTKSVDKFTLSFSFTNMNDEWSSLNNPDLTVFADGEKFVLSKSEQYSRQYMYEQPHTLTAEEFYFVADRETLSKLAKAKTLQFSLGSLGYKMSEDAQVIFRQILDLSTVK